MKRMARQVDGNIGKYAGGGRITAWGRYGRGQSMVHGSCYHSIHGAWQFLWMWFNNEAFLDRLIDYLLLFKERLWCILVNHWSTVWLLWNQLYLNQCCTCITHSSTLQNHIRSNTQP
jgi:hypothetical protein